MLPAQLKVIIIRALSLCVIYSHIVQFAEGFDYVAKGADYVWANPSGVTLQNGAVYSNMSDVLQVGNGTTQTLRFKLGLGQCLLEGGGGGVGAGLCCLCF